MREVYFGSNLPQMMCFVEQNGQTLLDATTDPTTRSLIFNACEHQKVINELGGVGKNEYLEILQRVGFLCTESKRLGRSPLYLASEEGDLQSLKALLVLAKLDVKYYKLTNIEEIQNSLRAIGATDEERINWKEFREVNEIFIPWFE